MTWKYQSIRALERSDSSSLLAWGIRSRRGSVEMEDVCKSWKKFMSSEQGDIQIFNLGQFQAAFESSVTNNMAHLTSNLGVDQWNNGW